MDYTTLSLPDVKTGLADIAREAEGTFGALNPAHPERVGQRLPVLPGVMGRIMVRSQAPETTRKFKAPTPSRQSTSDIGADVIQRFVEQHRDAVVRVAALDEDRAART